VRRRSPWLLYVAVLVSGGLFAFLWLIIFMRDVNRLERRPVFPVAAMTVIFLLSLLIYAMLIIFLPEYKRMEYSIRSTWIILIFALGIFITIFLIVELSLVHIHISRALEVGSDPGNVLTVIVFTILMFLSFVIVQRRLNTLQQRMDRKPE